MFINYWKYNQNRSKMIEYLILLKLLMNKYNIEFPIIFYKEILLYLTPTLNINIHLTKYLLYNKYYDYCNSNYFITKYNIKHNLFYKLNNIYISKENDYINKNIYSHIDICNTYHNNTKIILVKIYFINKFLIFNDIINIFEYNLPVKLLYIIKNIQYYSTFYNIMSVIWEDNNGLLMDDYICSNSIKKIIYYELFNKIVLRLLKNDHFINKI